MSKMVVLQSGFISQNDDMLELPIDYDRNFIDNVLMRNYKHEQYSYFFSKNISEYYTQYRSDNTLSKNFHFRERVYKEAFNLFKTKSFVEWVNLQLKYGNLSPIHKLFLMDTIKFILNIDVDAYSREVQPEQYIKLIERNIAKKEDSLSTSSYFDSKDMGQIQLLPNDLLTCIKLWLSKPKGFGDFLVSLHIIFGDRDGLVDINNQIIPL